MSESAGEKQFAPTAKRKADAAKKGDVLRSKELGTAVGVLAGTVWLYFLGGWLLASMETVARAAFGFGRGDILAFDPGAALQEAVLGIVVPIVTLGLMVMVLTVASQLAFSEGRFVAGNLAAKPSRLDPVKGLKRIFGPNGLIELGKSVLKVALLGGLAVWWGTSAFADLVALGRGDLHGQLATAWRTTLELLLLLAFGLALIAGVDFPIQWVRRNNKLKMSHQDMRDETKDSEGSPEKRMAIRSKQRQIAMGGINKAMKQAQFVLTNPTHFSVAMTYDPTLADAPVVLAKGRGEKALAIRELARELDVPVLEYPALARSVYFTTRENQVIRAELYAAVASVLSFVLSIKRGERRERPDIALPEHLHFDADGLNAGVPASS